MSVLATAEHRAVDDGVAADRDPGAVHIAKGNHLFAGITLAAAIYTAQIGVIVYRIDCSRHTHRATGHVDQSFAIHRGGLVAAIHIA